MQPQDLLPDKEDQMTLDNGVTIRKGSVGAFIANVEIIDREDPGSEACQQAIEDLSSLIPALEGIGFFRHFTLKSQRVQDIIDADKSKL